MEIICKATEISTRKSLTGDVAAPKLPGANLLHAMPSWSTDRPKSLPGAVPVEEFQGKVEAARLSGPEKAGKGEGHNLLSSLMGCAPESQVRTGLPAGGSGGSGIRTCMGLFLSSGCFGFC